MNVTLKGTFHFFIFVTICIVIVINIVNINNYFNDETTIRNRIASEIIDSLDEAKQYRLIRDSILMDRLPKKAMEY